MKTIWVIIILLIFQACNEYVKPIPPKEPPTNNTPIDPEPEVEPEPESEPEEFFIPLVVTNQIPDETKEIVSLFIFYGSLFNYELDYQNLIIEITNDMTGIAYCSRVNNNQNPKINLKQSYWSALNPTYKEMLLFHELGHCLLDRPHLGNDMYTPQSIMNTTLFSETIYEEQYDYFIKELFYDLNHEQFFTYGEFYIFIKTPS